MNLEDRLANWARCMRIRRQAHETPSKESDYRSPQRDHWLPPGSPVIPTGQADHADARIIDGAVSALPLRYNVVLRAHYIGGSKPQRMLALARQFGFTRPTHGDVDAMLAMGRAMLAKQLELPAVVRKERAAAKVREILALDEPQANATDGQATTLHGD